MQKLTTSFIIAGLLISCNPAMGLQPTAGEAKVKCLRSVEGRMSEQEAEAFCSQPAECRSWWDDLSEQEQQELQPPPWHKDPDWWVKCKLDKNDNDMEIGHDGN